MGNIEEAFEEELYNDEWSEEEDEWLFIINGRKGINSV